MLQNKIIACIASIMLVFCLCPMPALARSGNPTLQTGVFSDESDTVFNEDVTIVKRGTCGTCNWTIDSQGTLTISPMFDDEGTLGDWTSGSGYPPWNNTSYRSHYYDDDDDYSYYYYDDDDADSYVIRTVVFDGCVHAKTLESMFADCRSLTKVELLGLDTQQAKSAKGMFKGCSSLQTINLSGLDFSNITTMENMFDNCYALHTLSLESWNTGSLTNTQEMFQDCASLVSIELSFLNTGNITDMSRMFANCSSLESLDISSWNLGKVTNIGEMFSGCSSLKTLRPSSAKATKVTNCGSLFSGCKSLEKIDLSFLMGSKLVNTSSMFKGCAELTELDLSPLNTANVSSMSYMFSNCTKLKTLDISCLKAENVVDTSYMFANCTNLDTIDLSGFNTCIATNMSNMFAQCTNLKTILSIGPLPHRVYYYDYDYDYDYDDDDYYYYDDETYYYIDANGKRIYLDGYDEEEIEDSLRFSTMFLNCYKLKGENGTMYDENHIDISYARIDTANSPGYFTTNSARSVANAVISFSATSYPYTAAKITPTPNVTVNGVSLKKGVDFTVSYKNNVEAGTAIATIKGIGKYTGSVKATFEIAPVSLKDSRIEAYIGPCVYTGKARKPSPYLWIEDNDVSSKNYTVTYKNNTKIGTATATIVGKNSCKGTKTIKFKIVPKRVSFKSFTSADPTKVTAKVKTVKGATGYQFRITDGKNYVSKTKSTTKTTYTFSGLKENTRYYVDARAYSVVKGKKYYGEWYSDRYVYELFDYYLDVYDEADDPTWLDVIDDGAFNDLLRVTTPSMIGTWNLSSVKSSSGNVSASDMKTLRNRGYVYKLVLRKNGTGTLNMNGTKYSIKWKANKDRSTATATFNGSEKVNLSLNGKKLTMSEGAEELRFTKA